MTTRWELTNEVKEQYTPSILEFINSESKELNLSDTKLNPHTWENCWKVWGMMKAI